MLKQNIEYFQTKIDDFEKTLNLTQKENYENVENLRKVQEQLFESQKQY